MNVTKDDVRQARVRAGMTQPEAAAVLDMKRWQTWQEWELGVSPPNVPTYRLFLHLTGQKRIPFGTERPEGKASSREAEELAGKIAEMLTPKAVKRPRQR